ncbi:hypothetical protein BBJ28_00012650 [Nothophytophthora sp. Chile5]|nr:hypothetical protein BBJ28_00012650 [Nothophytophthora sp. Chile5]
MQLLLQPVQTRSLIIKLFSFFAFLVAATTAYNEECKANLLKKLLPLARDVNFDPCFKHSGYSVSFSDPKLPTLSQGVHMCASASCRALLGKVVALEMPSCDVKFGDVSFNPADIFNLAATHCK